MINIHACHGDNRPPSVLGVVKDSVLRCMHDSVERRLRILSYQNEAAHHSVECTVRLPQSAVSAM